MISKMSDDNQKLLRSAEHLIQKGDYNRARGLVKRIASKDKLSTEDKARMTRILHISGIDPFVVVTICFTLGVMILILTLYVL